MEETTPLLRLEHTAPRLLRFSFPARLLLYPSDYVDASLGIGRSTRIDSGTNIRSDVFAKVALPESEIKG